MRCLVVGCGSIGARRARLLAEMGHEVDGQDDDLLRAAKATNGHAVSKIMAYHLRAPYDAAFVCTPARSHLQVAHDVIAAGIKGLFIEKPLSSSMDGIPELIEQCELRGVVTMGACNMRWAYGPGPIDCAGILLESTAPLSSWRAGAAEFYRANGIVLEAVIHEIDVLADKLGPITWLDAIGNDHERVNIETEHASRGIGTINCDWREGVAVRREMALAERSYPDGGVRISAVVRADTSDEMYRREMAHFLECVATGTATTNPIANATETLRWALKAREMCKAVVTA